MANASGWRSRRALVTRPAILLLDEPLGALDEKLRIEMQSELVEIQRSLGVTFVYITHSQEEALTMSDRVVLLRSGRIEQSGAPVDLFDRPVSRFAAEFMGFENLLPGIVREAHADGRLVVAIGDVLIHGFSPTPAALPSGAEALVAVRAERLAPGDGRDAGPAQRRALQAGQAALSRQVHRPDGRHADRSDQAPELGSRGIVRSLRCRGVASGRLCRASTLILMGKQGRG